MSEFKIFDIQETQAEPGKKYLFDTNIWLTILGTRPHPSNRDRKYLNFLAAIDRVKASPKPKIVLPGFVVSEAINAGLNISFKMFQNNNPYLHWTGNHKKDFKKLYRPTDDFRGDFETLCFDLKSYYKLFEVVNDGFETFKLKEILRDLPTSLDYNDNYLYLLAKKRGYTIVTDDGDFFVPKVEILTANNELLKKANEQ